MHKWEGSDSIIYASSEEYSGKIDSEIASPRKNTRVRNDINWEWWQGQSTRFVPGERRPRKPPDRQNRGQACGSKRFYYAQRAWTGILSGACGVEGCINGEVQPVLFMRAVKNTRDRLIPRLLHPGRTPVFAMTLIGSGGRGSPRVSPRENIGPASPWTGKPGTGLRE